MKIYPKLAVILTLIQEKTAQKNLLIYLIAAVLILLIVNILLFRNIAGLNAELNSYVEKTEKISVVKKKLDNFYQQKPYRQEEVFHKKVPFDLISPIAAIREAGAIVQEAHFGEEIVVSQVSSQAKDSAISVGSKKIIPLPFSIRFTASYEKVLQILTKLSATEPLISIKSFRIEKESADPRLLRVDLQLNAFSVSGPELERLLSK